jgi:hypothetical protein
MAIFVRVENTLINVDNVLSVEGLVKRTPGLVGQQTVRINFVGGGVQEFVCDTLAERDMILAVIHSASTQ